MATTVAMLHPESDPGIKRPGTGWANQTAADAPLEPNLGSSGMITFTDSYMNRAANGWSISEIPRDCTVDLKILNVTCKNHKK